MDFFEPLSSILSKELIAGLGILAVTLRASYKMIRVSNNINNIVDSHKRQEKRQDDMIEALSKQQLKLIAIINSSPCISKRNGLWLQDIRRNGGAPPDEVICIQAKKCQECIYNKSLDED